MFRSSKSITVKRQPQMDKRTRDLLDMATDFWNECEFKRKNAKLHPRQTVITKGVFGDNNRQNATASNVKIMPISTPAPVTEQ